MGLCVKCNSNLVTVSRLIQEWDPDLEPYEAGKIEEVGTIFEDVMINGEYCTNCQRFQWLAPDIQLIESEGSDESKDS